MAISIRARFRNAMIGLSLALCAVFTFLLFMTVFTTEDRVFVNQLTAEKQLYERHQTQSPGAAWQPTNRRFKLIESAETLPASLTLDYRERIAGETGIHEYFDDEHAYFVNHFKRSDNGQAVFLLYDVSDLLAVRGNKLPIFLTIIVLTLIVTAGAVFIAHRLVSRTLEPVRKLRDELQHGELDDVVIDLANQFSEDEIGVLTRELALALGRVRDAAQREYEFNRGVSHELRSPIQVARSATELLELHAQNEGGQLADFVERLKRSVVEMNEIAEAFLWLASDRDVGPGDTCSVESVRETVATVQNMFPALDLGINTDLPPDFSFPLPQNVMAVIVRNLLRNAIDYGENQAIDINIRDRILAVKNATSQAAEDNRGFGIGLSIVQRICDRFDCELKTVHDPDGFYLASITFPELSKSAG